MGTPSIGLLPHDPSPELPLSEASHVIRWPIIAGWLREVARRNPLDTCASQWARDASWCDLIALAAATQGEMLV